MACIGSSEKKNEINLEETNLPVEHLELGGLSALSIQIWILRRGLGVRGWD